MAERINLTGTGGEGVALCSCKETSYRLPTAAARKRWHREHKARKRAEQVQP